MLGLALCQPDKNCVKHRCRFNGCVRVRYVFYPSSPFLYSGFFPTFLCKTLGLKNLWFDTSSPHPTDLPIHPDKICEIYPLVRTAALGLWFKWTETTGLQGVYPNYCKQLIISNHVSLLTCASKCVSTVCVVLWPPSNAVSRYLRSCQNTEIS